MAATRGDTKARLCALLLIVISGNPLIIHSSEWIYVGCLVLLSLYLILTHQFKVSGYAGKWLCGFCLLFVAQFLFVRTVSLPADINFFAKFLTAYFLVRICGDKFCVAYTDVIYKICLISLFFFTIHCLNFPIPGLKFNRYITLGIWNTIDGMDSYRNCGMFWEPGAFQGFIMLSFLFYIDRLKWLWENQRKKIIVFTAATLSTLSTTAYLVVFAYFFLLLLGSKIRIAYKVVLVACAAIGAVYAFMSFDFLGAKIQDQIEKSGNTYQANWSRTGAMFIDLVNIARHPFVGNGFLMDSRYPGLGELMSGSGNGLTGSINIFGFPMIIAYLIGIGHAWNNTRRYYRLTVVVVVTMILFGEYFLNYPLFWGLLFVRPPVGSTSVGYKSKIKQKNAR